MKIKKIHALVLLSIISLATLSACGTQTGEKETTGNNPLKTQTAEEATKKDYSGTFIGYSWAGESEGISLEESSAQIQTILTLDKDAKIIDASMLLFANVDGYKTLRQAGNAKIEVDFSVEPTNAILGENKTDGESMFKVTTNSTMSLFAVSVAKDSTIALLIVDPITRYSFEMKFKPEYDFDTKVGTLTLDRSTMFATTYNSKGLIVPEDWSELSDKSFLSISPFSHVFSDFGILKGITDESTIGMMLEKLGVVFENGKPLETQDPAVIYGYTGNGGWAGNYKSIEKFLIGKSAHELKSLVNWDQEILQKSINQNNFFGINTDTVSGATKSVQDSYDTISGSTMRMSRESESYQRALVSAGLLKEEEVIKGRF